MFFTKDQANVISFAKLIMWEFCTDAVYMFHTGLTLFKHLPPRFKLNQLRVETIISVHVTWCLQ